MVNIMFFLITIVIGVVISVFLSDNFKNMFLRCIIYLLLNVCLLITVLLVYLKTNEINPILTNIYYEKSFIIVILYIFIIISILIGITFGIIEKKGIKKYLKTIYSKKTFKIILCFIMFVSVMFVLLYTYSFDNEKNTNLVINEICSHNFDLIMSPRKEYSDYIELYNNSDKIINLGDFYISDDIKNLKKYNMPNYILKPYSYVIIWADGKKGYEDGSIYTNFKLSDDETIILTTKSGKIIDSIDYKKLEYNTSLSRKGKNYIITYGTPGISNDNANNYKIAKLEIPKYSLQSGFYFNDEVILEIESNEDVTIYYTLDGSIPDENSFKYTEPLILNEAGNPTDEYSNIKNVVLDYNNTQENINNISQDKANIVRAIAYDNQGNYSDVITGTFFVGNIAEKYKNKSVLSVIVEPDDLYGKNGIMVTGSEYDDWYNNSNKLTPQPLANFQKHGREWEREATIQLWNKEQLNLTQDCGIRVHGNISRHNPKKRFAFYARKIYNTEPFFDFDFFSNNQKIHSFYTKSSERDFIGSYLINDRNISFQNGMEIILFLNGQLYETTYIREKIDSNYYYYNYGIEENNLTLINDFSLDKGKTEDFNEFKNIVDFIINSDVSDMKIYRKIKQQLDIQSFIDYMAVNLYYNNLDFSLHHNIKVWRTNFINEKKYNDGKWHFVVYDLDNINYDIEIDPFKHAIHDFEKYGKENYVVASTTIFDELLKNAEFKNKFIITLLDLMNVNFNIDSLGGKILNQLNAQNNQVWIDMLTKRQPYLIKYLKKAMDIDRSDSIIEINIEGQGNVHINTSDIVFKNNSWRGIYISDLDISLSVKPETGWEFKGWKGDISIKERKINTKLTENGLKLTAVFEKIE